MLPLHHLNFNHLLYFWTVAREGGVTRASKKLCLSPSTISIQIKALEENLELKLFDRSTKRMTLTEVGEQVYEYATEIFTTSQQMLDSLSGHHVARRLKLSVGLADVIPKLVAFKLIEPALQLEQPIQITCQEDHSGVLLADLAAHKVDIVILDHAAGAESNVKVFNHLLGECGVCIYGTPELNERVLATNPDDPLDALNDAPFLLPTRESVLRRNIDDWFAAQDIHPQVIGEFEDSALMKTFGQRSVGLMPGPSVIAPEIRAQYGMHVLTTVEGCTERYYAVSTNQRLQHPGVRVLADSARAKVFG